MNPGRFLPRERAWSRALVALALFACAGAGPSVTAATFYASPTGTTSTAVGTGTISNPWALQTALSQPAAVHPGDTIWLRGGTYRGKYASHLTGTPAAPIIVRSYPGEWARIDSGTGNPSGLDILQVNGAYAWYWGFEIMSSDPKRDSAQNGSWPTDITRGGCASTNTGQGVGVKFINLVCHDAAAGINPWTDSSGAEVYGNLVYNNGWNGFSDRGNGHNLYAQNRSGAKYITDNIMFNSYDIGVHIYGSEAASLDNFTLDGNVVFNSGVVSRYGSVTNLVFGGGEPAANGVMTNNVIYSTRGSFEQIGYVGGVRPAVVRDNYFAPGFDIAVKFVNTLDVLTMTGNSFAGLVLDDASHEVAASRFPTNTYYRETRPTGVKVFIRPNRYEPGRGHISIINWDRRATVAVDVSSILTVGSSYEIRNAQNFFGPPVASGTYGGGTITLPMTGLTPAAPVGGSTPPVTGPDFNAFVVLPVGAVLPPPPPLASFSFSPASPQTNVPVTFTDTSTGGPTIWQWSFGDGGTSTLRNPTHTFATAGSYTVTLTATNGGGPGQASRTVTVTAAPVSSAPTRFFTVTPCRVLDTRNPNGPAGGPALAANGTRTFQVAGACGIPSTAVAVSVNATVINPSAQGQLRIYPGNIAPPSTSAISFRAGRTRANGGRVVLATDGTGRVGVRNDAAGTVHLVLDVNGYFR